ncbi:unnamed protein product [Owenia fusiformis]|uniref:Uncharacterized protein n=1 Tax=Owenia fusiformis TaxID=6347 RepID=A0A8S4PM98_OWEFU|nr:unnamed protein product [Owenia fusiformis]
MDTDGEDDNEAVFDFEEQYDHEVAGFYYSDHDHKADTPFITDFDLEPPLSPRSLSGDEGVLGRVATSPQCRIKQAREQFFCSSKVELKHSFSYHGGALTEYSDENTEQLQNKSVAIMEIYEEMEQINKQKIQRQMSFKTPRTPRTPISPGPPSATASPKMRMGLEHLDNLASLMEELSRLKNENAKLQQKCSYLEDTRDLLKAKNEILYRQKGSSNIMTRASTIGKFMKTQFDSAMYTSSPKDVVFNESADKMYEVECFNESEPQGHHKRTQSLGSYDPDLDLQDSVKPRTPITPEKEKNKPLEYSKSMKHRSNKGSIVQKSWKSIKSVFTNKPEADDYEDYVSTDHFDQRIIHNPPTIELSEVKSVDSGVESAGMRKSASSALTTPSTSLADSGSPSPRSEPVSIPASKDEDLYDGVWMGPPGWDARRGSLESNSSDASDSSSSIEIQRVFLKQNRKSLTGHEIQRSDSDSKIKPQVLKRRRSSPVLLDATADDLEEMDTELGSPILVRSNSQKNLSTTGSPPYDGPRMHRSHTHRGHRSAWGRVKDIIHNRRDSIKKRGGQSGRLQKSDSERSSADVSEFDIDDFLAHIDQEYDSSQGPQLPQQSPPIQDSPMPENLPGSPPKSDLLIPERNVSESRAKSKSPENSMSGPSPNVKKRRPLAKQHTSTVLEYGGHDMQELMTTTKPSQGKSVNIEALMDSINPEFNKKMKEWEDLKNKRMSISAGASTIHRPRATVDDCDMNRLSRDPKAPPINFKEIQKSLTDSFNRKLQDWEKKKYRKSRDCSPGAMPVVAETKSPERRGRKTKRYESKSAKAKERERAKSKEKSREDKEREKEIKRLEKQQQKELEKLERQQQKIEKERKRLEKLKALENELAAEELQEEGTVRTSIGNLPIDGLSEEFAKKLQEWEEMQKKKGILIDEKPTGEDPSTTRSGSLKEGTHSEHKSVKHRAYSSDSLVNLAREGSIDIQLEDLIADIKPQPDPNEKEASKHTIENELVNPDETDARTIMEQPITLITTSDLNNALNAITEPVNNKDTSKSAISETPSSPTLDIQPDKNVETINGCSQSWASTSEIIDIPSGQQNDSSSRTVIDSIGLSGTSSDSKVTSTSPVVQDEACNTEDNLVQSHEAIVTLKGVNRRLTEEIEEKERYENNLRDEIKRIKESIDNLNQQHNKEIESYKKELWASSKIGTAELNKKEVQSAIAELREKLADIERQQMSQTDIKESPNQREDSEIVERLKQEIQELRHQLHVEANKNSTKEDGEKEKDDFPFNKEDFEKLYEVAVNLQKQLSDLSQGVTERNKVILNMRKHLLIQEVTNMLLQTDNKRKDIELTVAKEARKIGLVKRWKTFGGADYFLRAGFLSSMGVRSDLKTKRTAEVEFQHGNKIDTSTYNTSWLDHLKAVVREARIKQLQTPLPEIHKFRDASSKAHQCDIVESIRLEDRATSEPPTPKKLKLDALNDAQDSCPLNESETQTSMSNLLEFAENIRKNKEDLASIGVQTSQELSINVHKTIEIPGISGIKSPNLDDKEARREFLRQRRELRRLRKNSDKETDGNSEKVTTEGNDSKEYITTDTKNKEKPRVLPLSTPNNSGLGLPSRVSRSPPPRKPSNETSQPHSLGRQDSFGSDKSTPTNDTKVTFTFTVSPEPSPEPLDKGKSGNIEEIEFRVSLPSQSSPKPVPSPIESPIGNKPILGLRALEEYHKSAEARAAFRDSDKSSSISSSCESIPIKTPPSKRKVSVDDACVIKQAPHSPLIRSKNPRKLKNESHNIHSDTTVDMRTWHATPPKRHFRHRIVSSEDKAPVQEPDIQAVNTKSELMSVFEKRSRVMPDKRSVSPVSRLRQNSQPPINSHSKSRWDHDEPAKKVSEVVSTFEHQTDSELIVKPNTHLRLCKVPSPKPQVSPSPVWKLKTAKELIQESARKKSVYSMSEHDNEGVIGHRKLMASTSHESKVNKVVRQFSRDSSTPESSITSPSKDRSISRDTSRSLSRERSISGSPKVQNVIRRLSQTRESEHQVTKPQLKDLPNDGQVKKLKDTYSKTDSETSDKMEKKDSPKSVPTRRKSIEMPKDGTVSKTKGLFQVKTKSDSNKSNSQSSSRSSSRSSLVVTNPKLDSTNPVINENIVSTLSINISPKPKSEDTSSEHSMQPTDSSAPSTPVTSKLSTPKSKRIFQFSPKLRFKLRRGQRPRSTPDALPGSGAIATLCQQTITLSSPVPQQDPVGRTQSSPATLPDTSEATKSQTLPRSVKPIDAETPPNDSTSLTTDSIDGASGGSDPPERRRRKFIDSTWLQKPKRFFRITKC